MRLYVLLTVCAAAAAAAALQEDYQAEPEEESEVRTPGRPLCAAVGPHMAALLGDRGLTCLLCTTGCWLPGTWQQPCTVHPATAVCRLCLC
jgi:hypothetical protein